MTFDPTSSYTLEDLKPDTLYHFQLAARSDMGVGVFTPTIEARTAQSSKCLLRPLSVTPRLGYAPSPSVRLVVRSTGSHIGLWFGLLSLDPEKGTGKCSLVCPGGICSPQSLPSPQPPPSAQVSCVCGSSLSSIPLTLGHTVTWWACHVPDLLQRLSSFPMALHLISLITHIPSFMPPP